MLSSFFERVWNFLPEEVNWAIFYSGISLMVRRTWPPVDYSHLLHFVLCIFDRITLHLLYLGSESTHDLSLQRGCISINTSVKYLQFDITFCLEVRFLNRAENISLGRQRISSKSRKWHVMPSCCQEILSRLQLLNKEYLKRVWFIQGAF